MKTFALRFHHRGARRWHRITACFALAAALASSACGDDAVSSEVDRNDAGGDHDDAGRDAGDHGDAGDAGADREEPAFLIGTRVWSDTTTTSYFHVVPSIDRGTEVDQGRALEVPGAAKLYAVQGAGWFAVGSGEEPTITRYTLGEEGRLERREAISLQSYGVTSLWDTLYVVSPTKMYYPDRDGQRLIIINPTSMEIEGEVELPETARTGYLSLYSYAHLSRGDRLLFSVAWIDWNETDSIVAETGLVVLDTVSDTVSRFDVDTRCGGITQPVVSASGDAYFASSALAGAVHHLGRLSTEPCALRVLARQDRFDPGYLLKLAELGHGTILGEPVPGGEDSVFLRVFDEEIGSVAEGALSWELTGQAAWRWLRWNVDTDEVAMIEELEPSTSDVPWFQADGRVYAAQTTEDYAETTLYDLSADGGPTRAMTAPGFLHGVARIR